MEMDPRLKTAAETGDIDVLHVLIRGNPHILEDIDKIPFIQTPLHIAAHEGQMSFATEMINLKPSFAKKLNLDGLSPMHLALINGQTKLVLRLLKADEDLVRVKGWQGMTPFHYAATTGNSKLLFEFLEACPECIEDVTVRDETALHLALKHDHVEAFKLLFGWLLRSPLGHKIIAFETKMVNWKDNDDNTGLHIAAMKEQREALKLLLDSSILLRVKAKNSEGLTAQDIMEKVERPDTNIDVKDEEDHIEIDFWKEKVNCVERYFVLGARARRCMSVDVINTMLVVMALIITAVYQSSLSPPGGVWQGDNNDSTVTTSVSNVVRRHYESLLPRKGLQQQQHGFKISFRQGIETSRYDDHESIFVRFVLDLERLYLWAFDCYNGTPPLRFIYTYVPCRPALFVGELLLLLDDDLVAVAYLVILQPLPPVYSFARPNGTAFGIGF